MKKSIYKIGAQKIESCIGGYMLTTITADEQKLVWCDERGYARVFEKIGEAFEVATLLETNAEFLKSALAGAGELVKE